MVMKIEMVWGDQARQTLIELGVETGATVAEAVELAMDQGRLPKEVFDPQRVGIFGSRCAMDQVLKAGDRIELYRPLIADPKEVRRALAEIERAKKGTVV